MHSDERRIAALLRELITQDGAPVETIEGRLGWEPGRLGRLLGGQDLSFDTLLEVLPALDATPGDFFARLHTYDPAGREERSRKAADRRFEESRRVVKAAVARRLAGKTTGKASTAAPAGAGAARDASSGSG